MSAHAAMSAPRSPQVGAAILRISLGAMWIAHALLKLLVFSPEA